MEKPLDYDDAEIEEWVRNEATYKQDRIRKQEKEEGAKFEWEQAIIDPNEALASLKEEKAQS